MSEQEKRGRGRPKLDEPLEVYPVRLKQSTIDQLRSIENHSKFVRELIERAMQKAKNASRK